MAAHLSGPPCTGEPNNYDGTESCVAFDWAAFVAGQQRGWNDVPCGLTKYNVVCEERPPNHCLCLDGTPVADIKGSPQNSDCYC